MTAEELRAIGLRIYGERWQSTLAAALGLNLRTVQRWAQGRNPIDDRVAERIKTLERIVTENPANKP